MISRSFTAGADVVAGEESLLVLTGLGGGARGYGLGRGDGGSVRDMLYLRFRTSNKGEWLSYEDVQQRLMCEQDVNSIGDIG